jgi:hypothetical protein
MPRSEILDLMSELKLFGMKAVSAHGLLHLNNPPFIARTIVEHLRLSRWRWWRDERSVGRGYMARMCARDAPPDDGKNDA